MNTRPSGSVVQVGYQRPSCISDSSRHCPLAASVEKVCSELIPWSAPPATRSVPSERKLCPPQNGFLSTVGSSFESPLDGSTRQELPGPTSIMSTYENRRT